MGRISKVSFQEKMRAVEDLLNGIIKRLLNIQ